MTRPTGIARDLTHYGDPAFSLFIRGAYARGSGLTPEDLGRPIIGIAQTWSEFNPCHRHLREVAEAINRGVWQVGGLPLEFPTISLARSTSRPRACYAANPGPPLSRWAGGSASGTPSRASSASSRRLAPASTWRRRASC